MNRFLLFLFFSLCSNFSFSNPSLEGDVEKIKAHLDGLVKGGGKLSDERIQLRLKEMASSLEVGTREYYDVFNLIGVSYLLSKDESMVIKSESFFKIALEGGVEAAAQNLAELEFYRDRYKESLYYLSLISNDYIKGERNRVRYYRLKGQILFLSGEVSVNRHKAVDIFEDIEGLDESGISSYFIGFDLFYKGELNLALEKFNSSISLGNESSMMFLGDLYYQGEYVERNIGKASEYYEMAYSLDNARAAFNLAMIYREKQDIEKLKDYIRRAAELGHEKALHIFEKIQQSKPR
ncbi:hypothetical protein PRUB_a4622 [Pseudoalteromonas rubra]|uniref:Sel1 repeat family protein n=1 Tax=Pseudoalteromonas rubra TaxID=43658 RepID=A0A8T0CA06_9GAMM|nr:tetratricopeptide repeat protein [Pseudoalteromonas rubra]KAF7787519.1 hypothetical protein PRUB_a4622 [Pseudoalteromonas rubra]